MMAQQSAGGRDTRFLRDEIRQLEKQLEQKDRELEDMEKELDKEKKVNEQNEQLRQDIIDYQKQIDSQKESLLSRRGEDSDYRSQLSKKNFELVQYLDEIQTLTEANEKIEVQNQEMRKNLEESVQEMEKMTDEYNRMKAVVHQTDTVMDQIKKENEHYRLQVQELSDLLKAKDEEDDPVMIAVNAKVEEWKGIQERDSQIKMLTEQVEQYTKEMEKNTFIIEDLKNELKKDKGTSNFHHQTHYMKIHSKVQILEEKTKEAERTAELAEADAREKDKELVEALKRLKDYESNLLNALQRDSNEMKKMLSENSRKITVLQVNEKSLIRKYTTLVELERQLRKENGKHKNDLISMEAEVTEKIGSLQRYKLTKINLDAQKVEQMLRDELADSVNKAVSDADRQRILELEKNEVELKVEVSKLREISDIAKRQVDFLNSQQQSREKEVESLRMQLLDYQAQSDEKALIAKLHQHVVSLQISEATALGKLESVTSKLQKMEAYNLRLEQKLDEKEQTLFYARLEGRNRAKHLRQTIQSLRRQFSGALPLAQQEKFSKTMIQLQNDKLKIMQEMKNSQQERRNMENKTMEMELKLKGLEELISTLKDARGAQKDLIKQSPVPVPTNKHFIRLAEMEQTVAEQDNSLASLLTKLKKVSKDLESQKEITELKVREFENMKLRLQENHLGEMKKVKVEVEDLRRALLQAQKESQGLKSELQAQKEANSRAPTTTMRNLVDRLKSQLALKEKQQKALSRALLELRAEMTAAAEERIIAVTSQKEANLNVQQVVDRHTRELKSKSLLDNKQSLIDELQKKVKKLESQLERKVDDIDIKPVKEKVELEKLKAHFGRQLSMEYESKNKGTMRVIVENERLRKELKKEMETSENLRIAKNNLELVNDKMVLQLEETSKRLQFAESRGPQLEGADSKSWKSIVVTRMYETKMKELESDISKKNQSIVDLKQLVREATEREQKAKKYTEDLEQQACTCNSL
ncbi:centrosomal protein 290 [Cricetulus griseus]